MASMELGRALRRVCKAQAVPAAVMVSLGKEMERASASLAMADRRQTRSVFSALAAPVALAVCVASAQALLMASMALATAVARAQVTVVSFRALYRVPVFME
jgi:hypothetical protein